MKISGGEQVPDAMDSDARMNFMNCEIKFLIASNGNRLTFGL
jgi:hypothetical protein